MSTAVQLTSPRTNENRRTALRRSLRLKAVLADCDVEIVIHDISATGMLIQTAHELAPGETLTLDLPERGSTAATVAWNSGSYYGCEFELSLPAAAVSAAVLRGEPLGRTFGSPAELTCRRCNGSWRKRRPRSPRSQTIAIRFEREAWSSWASARAVGQPLAGC
jgi:hypothetical protein